MEFVKLVQKRYYFIHRLERPMKTLFYLYEKLISKQHESIFYSLTHSKIHKKIIIEPGTALLFRHDAVRKYVKKIEQTQKIDPVKELWDDFLAYKYIECDEFVQETLKAILLLYKNLIFSVSYPKNADSHELLATHEIDILFHNNNSEVHDNFACIFNLINSFSDSKDFIVNNSLRLYLISRLNKSIKVLSTLKSHHLDNIWHRLNVAKKINTIKFNHEAIAQCVDLMIEAKNFEPLFNLWQKFNAYNYIDDLLFLKEFVSMQFIIYSSLIPCLQLNQNKVPTPQEIIELYDTIAGLPMPEALDSLDLLVEELIIIIEKYELDSQMSWNFWFKKYWWVVPVSIISFYFHYIFDAKRAVIRQ